MTQIELDSLYALRSSLPAIAENLEKLNSKPKFIKLRTVAESWSSYGSSYSIDDGRYVYVRLDTVVRLNELKTVNAFQSWEQKAHSNKTTKIKIGTIIGGGAVNLGMNGSDTSITIDEESYNRLAKELGIEL